MHLKRKIANARRALLKKNTLESQKMCPGLKKRILRPGFVNIGIKTSYSSEDHNLGLKLKNAPKNFGRAICNFILSDYSEPYLRNCIQKYQFSGQDFLKYIQEKRKHFQGIIEFRSLLLIESNDSELIQQFKLSFQYLAEIFIKFFSVNWIFNSRLEYKLEYLKCRHKFLRRIKNPRFFTPVS